MLIHSWKLIDIYCLRSPVCGCQLAGMNGKCRTMALLWQGTEWHMAEEMGRPMVCTWPVHMGSATTTATATSYGGDRQACDKSLLSHGQPGGNQEGPGGHRSVVIGNISNVFWAEVGCRTRGKATWCAHRPVSPCDWCGSPTVIIVLMDLLRVPAPVALLRLVIEKDTLVITGVYLQYFCPIVASWGSLWVYV